MARTIEIWTVDDNNVLSSWTNHLLLTKRKDGTYSLKAKQHDEQGVTNVGAIHSIRTADQLVAAISECCERLGASLAHGDLRRLILPKVRILDSRFAAKLAAYLKNGDVFAQRNQMFNDLLAYVQQKGRVCPIPDRWNALWNMLPAKRHIGDQWQPAVPLILAAWRNSSTSMKRERLADHIRHAHKHGVLADVDRYLRSLSQAEWAYVDEPFSSSGRG
jgi:hypothetical protein